MQRTGADNRHGGDCDANRIINTFVHMTAACVCCRWFVFVGALPVFRHARFRLGVA